MRNENGGILLELTIMAFLVMAFSAGTVRIHRSFHARFEKIIEHRNKGIRAIRTHSP